MNEKYLVVFDTVALVQRVIAPEGNAAKCFAYFEAGIIAVAISRATLKELKDVLSRPYIRDRFPHITDEMVTWLSEFLLEEGEYQRTVPRHFTYPRDPKDEPPINLAIEANAHYLISRDKDLLDLMDWNNPDGREFQRRFRWLKIVKPEEFLLVMADSDKRP